VSFEKFPLAVQEKKLFAVFLIYCESILFRGAEISSFEDDGHIRGYLTSWIALPTKLKKYKIITFNF